MKKRELAAYGAASIADAGPYSLVTVYLIVFLTTVAKLSPEQAGMVTSVTILVNGIAEGLLGYISDHTKSRFGRRRPYLLASLVPLGAMMTDTPLPVYCTICGCPSRISNLPLGLSLIHISLIVAFAVPGTFPGERERTVYPEVL